MATISSEFPRVLPKGRFTSTPGYDVGIINPTQLPPSPLQAPQGQQPFPVQPPVVPPAPAGVNPIGPPPSTFDIRKLITIILRFVATVMTFLGTVVVGTSLKSRAPSQIIYFISANAIALVYSVAALVISGASLLTRNQQKGGLEFVVKIGDFVIVVFLFSAIGSASATISFACDGSRIDSYCEKRIAGIVLSLLGSFAYLVLNIFSIFNVH